MVFDPSQPLPGFREDLQLFDGPADPDGSPTFNLYDPVSGQYFHLSWGEAEIFRQHSHGISCEQLVEKINSQTPLKVEVDEVLPFIEQALGMQLLRAPINQPKASPSIFQKLFSTTLYIRFPLFQPDKWLTNTWPTVRPLFSSLALWFYVLVGIVGVFSLLTQLDQFYSTFLYFFSFQGLVAYAVALSCVKVVHELAHAFVAKRYGVHIRSMGVALLVMWPVLYTDVTDSWRLKRRRERLAISMAGVGAELVIAAFATIGWTLSSPGMLQSIFFILASASWLSTLLVNLNPALRFDGYYILSDLWGVDNLQSRAFAHTRWWFRKTFFGIDAPHPERAMSSGRGVGFVIYSIYTFLYRVGVYTAIALILYARFTKLVGILLLVIGIYQMLYLPLVTEIKEVQGSKLGKRGKGVLAALLLVLAYLIVPLPHTANFPAVVVPVKEQVLYAPFEARIETIAVKEGEKVTKGSSLIEMSFPTLAFELRTLQTEVELLETELRILTQSDEERSKVSPKLAQLQRAQAELAAKRALVSERQLVAGASGTLYFLDESLREGSNVSKEQLLARVADLTELKLLAFVAEQDYAALQEGSDASFYLRDRVAPFSGRVEKLQAVRTPFLLYPQLGSLQGGPLPVVRGDQDRLQLVETFYPVDVPIEGTGLKIGQTGEVELSVGWRSPIVQAFRYVTSLLWKESGL